MNHENYLKIEFFYDLWSSIFLVNDPIVEETKIKLNMKHNYPSLSFGIRAHFIEFIAQYNYIVC